MATALLTAASVPSIEICVVLVSSNASYIIEKISHQIFYSIPYFLYNLTLF